MTRVISSRFTCRGAALAVATTAVTFAAAVCVVAALTATTAATAAIVETTTPAGLRYASGGIGEAEVQTMRAKASNYTLRVITAAKSGAYLSAVQARLSDAQGRVLLDHTMEGPWLLAALAPGRYRLDLRHAPAGQPEQVQRHDIVVGERGTTEVMARFDAPS